MEAGKVVPVAIGGVTLLAALAGAPVTPVVAAALAEAGASAGLVPAWRKNLAKDFRKGLDDFRDAHVREFSAVSEDNRASVEWRLERVLEALGDEAGAWSRQRLLGAARRGFTPFREVLMDLLRQRGELKDVATDWDALGYLESLLTLIYADVARVALLGPESELADAEAARQFEAVMKAFLSDIGEQVRVIGQNVGVRFPS